MQFFLGWFNIYTYSVRFGSVFNIRYKIFDKIRFGFCTLILLIFRDEGWQTVLSLQEIKFLHTLGGIMVEIRLSSEHCLKLVEQCRKHILNRGRIWQRSSRYIRIIRWYVAYSSFNIMRNPFDVMRTVLIL